MKNSSLKNIPASVFRVLMLAGTLIIIPALLIRTADAQRPGFKNDYFKQFQEGLEDGTADRQQNGPVVTPAPATTESLPNQNDQNQENQNRDLQDQDGQTQNPPAADNRLYRYDHQEKTPAGDPTPQRLFRNVPR